MTPAPQQAYGKKENIRFFFQVSKARATYT